MTGRKNLLEPGTGGGSSPFEYPRNIIHFTGPKTKELQVNNAILWKLAGFQRQQTATLKFVVAPFCKATVGLGAKRRSVIGRRRSIRRHWMVRWAYTWNVVRDRLDWLHIQWH